MRHISRVMNMELINSLTITQLQLCEKEDLINYIKYLKEEKTIGENHPLHKFIEERCIHTASDESYPHRAPTHYQDIYYEYKVWCQGLGLNHTLWNKKKILQLLCDWQRSSIYGFSVGKSLGEGKQNGTMRLPYFNLVVISED